MRPDLQHRTRAESRRLRTLFDQQTAFDHPLLRQLKELVDSADARHVEVTVDCAGEVPDLSEEHVSSIVTPLRHTLDACTAAARLVVNSTPNNVTVSILGQGMDPNFTPHSELQRDGIRVVANGDRLWVVIHQDASTPVGTATAS